MPRPGGGRPGRPRWPTPPASRRRRRPGRSARPRPGPRPPGGRGRPLPPRAVPWRGRRRPQPAAGRKARQARLRGPPAGRDSRPGPAAPGLDPRRSGGGPAVRRARASRPARRAGPIGPGDCLHRKAGSRPRSAGRKPRGPEAPAARDDPMPGANMAPVSASVPLSTLLSQALVAYTIEPDNEAEPRLPHRTNRQHDPDAGRGGPWLVSFALYANVLQYADADDTRGAALGA